MWTAQAGRVERNLQVFIFTSHPALSDPLGALLNNQHKQKSVKHKGATDSTAFGNFFFIFGEHFLAC